MRFILAAIMCIATVHVSATATATAQATATARAPAQPVPATAPAQPDPAAQAPAPGTPAANGLGRNQNSLLTEKFKYIYYKNSSAAYRDVNDSDYRLNGGNYQIQQIKTEQGDTIMFERGQKFYIDEKTAQTLIKLVPADAAIELKGDRGGTKYISRKELNLGVGKEQTRVFIDHGSTKPTKKKS